MQTRFIEATQSISGETFANHGKFMLGRFTLEEWSRRCQLDDHASLLLRCGWDTYNLLVLDLQTGEGAIIRPGGMARADLEKHRIWVCPMFQPFLEWLYQQDLSNLEALPLLVELPAAEFAMAGFRRPGEATRRGPGVASSDSKESTA